MLFAFGLRIIALDRLGLAYDESASAAMAQAGAGEIVRFHWHAAFEHPPLWVLLLNSWSTVAGQSEFALRLLPAFAGVALVAMAWRLTATIWPDLPLLAPASALFVATAPVLVYYSQEARMYTLVVLLMLVTTRQTLALQSAPTWGRIVAYWLVSWAMLGLHYYAALALAIQAAVVCLSWLLTRGRRQNWRQFPWFKGIIAFLGAVLPLVAWMAFSPGFQTTLEVVLDKASENPVSWQWFLGDLWRELTFGSIRWQPDHAEWSYVVAPLVVLGALLLLLRRDQSPLARVSTWLILITVALPVLIGVLALRTMVPRYILWIVPLLYLLAAVPGTLLWGRNRFASLLLFAVVIFINAVALQYYFGPYRKSEYREMTTYLQSHGDASKEILLLEAPRQHLLAKYYVPDAWQIHPMPTIDLPAHWPVTAPLIVPEDEDDRIQEWLSSYTGLWVSYSSEAEVDSGEFLAKYLTAVSYREQCTQWLDVRLCHYISPRHLSLQRIAFTPRLFGNELALLGAQATLAPSAFDASNILIQLAWLAQQKPTVEFKVALRIVDTNGNVIDQADDYPIGPLLPPTTWNAGDEKPGYVTLRLPNGIARGSYVIQLTLYDPNTLAPIPYVALDMSLLGQGDSAATDGAPDTAPVTLAEVQVGDTMQLLSPAATR